MLRRLFRSGAAVGSSTLLGASYLAIYFLIVLGVGIAKLICTTKINPTSWDVGKGKGDGMGKNSLGFVKLSVAALLETVHGLSMNALVAVALP